MGLMHVVWLAFVAEAVPLLHRCALLSHLVRVLIGTVAILGLSGQVKLDEALLEGGTVRSVGQLGCLWPRIIDLWLIVSSSHLVLARCPITILERRLQILINIMGRPRRVHLNA